MFVDNNLTWSDHIKHLTKKIASSIWLLSKIKKFLSQDHRVQFYKSYIQPHIDFCSIVWGSSSESNKLKIFKLQKRACKVILDFNVDDPNEAMNSLKIMSIYDRLYLRKAKFMFKIFNNVAPAYISESFTLRNNVNTSINLRSSSAGCFIPPKPRTEYFKHSMRYSGCLVWNSLPEEIKSAQTIDTFHSRCLDVLKKSGKYPCGVCQSGVGSSNAVFCGGCKRWVHKKCSGIKGPLRPDPEFRCARCLGTARAIDEREVSEVEVGNEKLEVVPEFCYLGDILSAGGGCELAAITRCKCAWGKFRQLLPLLTNRHLPVLTRGKVYSSCVRSVMLHAAETWAMKVDTLNRLRRNDRAMIRWICNVRAKDEVSSDSLLTKLGIQDLDVVLRTSRMRWFGHVERSTGWIAEVRKLNVVAQKRSGRPRKSWDEVLENDRKKLGMDSADPQNRSEWRGRLRERLVKKPNPR